MRWGSRRRSHLSRLHKGLLHPCGAHWGRHLLVRHVWSVALLTRRARPPGARKGGHGARSLGGAHVPIRVHLAHLHLLQTNRTKSEPLDPRTFAGSKSA